MIYAVDKYQDVVKVKKKKEYWIDHVTPIFHYFDTEGEARAYIRMRALSNVAAAKETLAKAKKRLKKCETKFAFRLGDARDILKVTEPSTDAAQGKE